MDSSATTWLPETELENLNFKDDEFDFMKYMDEELVALMEEGVETNCVSPKNNPTPISSSTTNSESTNSSSLSSFSTSSAPVLLNFENPNSTQNTNLYADAEEPKHSKNMKEKARIRPPSQTYDHIVAERRRREQISNYFVALSTIVPGLKKMDKSSIMGATITHLQHLQERVKSLEEEAAARNKSMKSVVLVKKSDDELLEIEGRVCDAQILIKIECEYRKGLLANLIAQLERLNLTILTTHALRFGMLALEITMITKMEKDFNSSVNQVLKSLQDEIKHVN